MTAGIGSAAQPMGSHNPVLAEVLGMITEADHDAATVQDHRIRPGPLTGAAQGTNVGHP
jgi:hypothetical protein